MNECLQLLIKELRHLQHDLESTLRIDDFCKDIFLGTVMR
jgi:hypothetical protein